MKGHRKPFTCSPLYTGEWVCTLKTAYPFIRHFPIAIAMSISRVSDCARICGIRRKRVTVSYKHRAAPGVATTGNGAILLPSHSRTQWGQLGEILGGVRFPWSWQPPAV